MYYYAGNNPVEVSDPLGLYQLHVNPNCCPDLKPNGSPGVGSSAGMGYGNALRDCAKEMAGEENGTKYSISDDRCKKQKQDKIYAKIEEANKMLNGCKAAFNIFDTIVYKSKKKWGKNLEMNDLFTDNNKGPEIIIDCSHDPYSQLFGYPVYGEYSPKYKSATLFSGPDIGVHPEKILHELGHYLANSLFTTLTTEEAIAARFRMSPPQKFYETVKSAKIQGGDRDPMGYYIEILASKNPVAGDYCAY